MRTEKHWEEIFNVLLTEVNYLIHVIDARNPIGTFNYMMEDFVKHKKPNLEMLVLINKADIIPKKINEAWLKYYEEQGYDVMSISAKYTRGILPLLKHLRHKALGPLNVLIVGYPNTGKSTLIQALTQNKKKVGISSKAGFTRGITKIKLNTKIYLIDSPGVIPIDETDEVEMAIKACMVADKLDDPLAVVESIFQLLPISQFNHLYEIDLQEDATTDELIETLGKKWGRLKSGGEINEPEVQKKIIRDWQSNILKYYVKPPNMVEDPEEDEDYDNFVKKEDINAKEKNSGLIPASRFRKN